MVLLQSLQGMALFHELQLKGTLTFGMCFTEELSFIRIAGVLLMPILRGYYRDGDIRVYYLQTWYKNNHGNAPRTFLRTRPAVWPF